MARTIPLREVDVGAPKRRRKPSSGATPMRHARAWIAARHPGAPVLEAQKAVVWIPDECPGHEGERRPINRREDLFGAFDFLVLAQRVVLVQVTTESAGAKGGMATARKRKVRTEFLEKHRLALDPLPEVIVLAWVPRTCFHGWWWDWQSWKWSGRREVESPLLKQSGVP